MTKLSVIDAGRFKLDGGAMFGVVPKTLWSKLNPPDDNNLCTWALRCLLVETDDRKILFDTGIGQKQGERFMSHFHPHGDATLLGSLAENGVNPEDITDVFLTHLHFDHCGGALTRKEDGNIVPTFPNATYWSHSSHVQWALHPNPREKASFLTENIQPLLDHGVLKYISPSNAENWLGLADVFFVYGHTEAMMIPRIKVGDQTVVFCADLLPSQYHVRMPYVMSYDIRPLDTLQEKRSFFDEAITGEYVLFMEHDPVTECITLGRDDRGRYLVKDRLTLAEAIQS